MRLALIAAVLCLAACSGSDSAGNASGGGSATVEPVPGKLSVDAQNTIAPPGNAAVMSPVPLPTASPSPIATIPAGFQGRWGMVSADCDPSTGADKGALTIAGNRLSFYESRGSATKLRQTQPTQIAFDLPMSGEGMTWSEPTTLTLLDDGKTLIRGAKGSPDRAGAFRYNRCPA